MNAADLIELLKTIPPKTKIARPARANEGADLPWVEITKAEIEPNFHGESPFLLK